MQHLISNYREEDVEYEVQTEDLQQRNRGNRKSRINRRIVDVLEGSQPAFNKRRLKYQIQ